MQTTAIDLSIIIVNFNTRQMTLACLRSIYAETRDISYEIIVVDNNSVDDSANAIATEFPGVRLIALGENTGFARGNNIAAKEARGRRILLLNPDTAVLDHAIDRLVGFANETPMCRLWGGRTLFKDGSLNPFSCWRRMTLWSLACFAIGLTYAGSSSPILSPETYGGWKRDTVRHVDIVSGCFLMIDRALWDQLGGFDPTFYMYGEEADLCLRARRAGARPIITPHATIVHYGGASAPSTLERLVMLFKGKATLVNRHWSPVSRRMGRVLFLLVPVVRWWGYGLSAQLSGREDFHRSADNWRMMWVRRKDWIDGYSVDKC
jgi:GT2 family glycosyltransferase